MSIKKYLHERIITGREIRLIELRRRYEIKKFEDPRRKEIYETILLSDEQKRRIDELFLENYGEKIPYTWHRHFTAFTGQFDVNYFPELLFIPEFQHFMNANINYIHVFADKNVLSMIAAGIGVRMPETYISCANGVLRDREYHIIDFNDLSSILKDEVCFAKPTVGSSSGNGCFLYHGGDAGDAQRLLSLGKNFAIQEKIRCSSSIAALHPESVNTFRVMTYIWKGQIEAAPVIMRIGRGASYLDNAHAGGMFIAINEEGTLHEKAFTEFRDIYTEHPDSHIVFSGYKIKNYHKVVETAKKLHSAIPQLGVVNWDLTLSESEEPVLIEANTRNGSIWLFQMAWGCGAFGDRTWEILQWIREQKRLLYMSCGTVIKTLYQYF